MKLLMAATAAALIVCLAACGGPDDQGGSTLHWNGDESIGGDFGFSQADVKPGDVIAFGSIELCVKGSAPATIDTLTFATNDHVRISRFAVRQVNLTTQGGLGSLRGSILTAGFKPTSTTVNTPCRSNATGNITELGLDVSTESATTATGRTLVVSYHSGDHRDQTTIPLTLKLCPGPGSCS